MTKISQNVTAKNGMWKRGRAPIVPVTVLTGFLGSGKTTLMNRILNDKTHGMKFAVIENEFGDVGIDEHILSENVDEEVIEVMNGCICCTVRGDLVEALKKLYNHIESFNGVIIETTGLADPAPVIQTFFSDEDLKSMYKLDSCITVVDTKYINTRLDEKKPEGIENEAMEQVIFADKIILNKTDLAKDENTLKAIEDRLHKINPNAPILRCEHSSISPKELLNIRAFDLKRVLKFQPTFLDMDVEHEHDSSVKSVSCIVKGEVNIRMMECWIRRLLREEGANLYRYKGIIAVSGKDQPFVFQGVGMMFDGEFQGEWKFNEERESRFVFIGKNLDRELLKKGFEACRINQELRFSIGDVVETNVGEWEKGEIVKTLDNGNAYRIKLNKGGEEVLGPVDIDAYVRTIAV